MQQEFMNGVGLKVKNGLPGLRVMSLLCPTLDSINGKRV